MTTPTAPTSPIRIAVTGHSGQVAQALVEVAARDPHISLHACGRPEIDLTQMASLRHFVDRVAPHVIVNAGGYTAVDRAEEEKALAFGVNAEGAANVAEIAASSSIPLIHISTDYVFDGAATRPYRETDPVAPLGVYGASKAAGEAAVRSAAARHIILRTAWVHSPYGQNFVRTMLRLAAEQREVRVVADQRGTPTSALEIALAILSIARRVADAPPEPTAPWGTYHLTGAGETTWHGLAEETFRLLAASGRARPRLTAITTEEYPTRARRPHYSVLDNAKIEREFGIKLKDWRIGLAATLERLGIADSRERCE